MYYKIGDLVFGVLSDYDLSSIQDTLSGNKLTGTIPFMVIELLTLEGKKHIYRHDAESFIWVLTWVCLQYENGNLKPKHRLLDGWLKVDAIRCLNQKSGFLLSGRMAVKTQPSPSHQVNWEIAQRCLTDVAAFYSNRLEMSDECVFQTWLQAHVQPFLESAKSESGHSVPDSKPVGCV
jgi:hypothetical protein